ncbi:hypothetical protein EGY07_09130 [Chryseobacterium indologenes]|uniref:hypothetical protein n=1 Tax=Chryseobacterium indologenes TaxID=253 RepID=UPI000B517D2B|nr:hypothetical protein [Chryseobacterium indologenes]ASE61206.1 hypothetical protein CEQ15_06690 [Chryseobacterium indologenes]AYZ35721.1 hypothetical protein EGY07_09130 [Chryseobacterium indologenes]MBF6644491.1 hypothetical protein [Chryseobacterium indologenes]MBU3050463.1 hypothetical protein [Chryseobacterium indologenes]MEB4760093.1 hypothetical protein [Chryseobacterium indologenes]
MKTNLIVLFIALFSLSSCVSDEASAGQVNSAFQGNWSGNFTGDESGTLNFVVQKEGTIVGEIHLNQTNTTEPINGYVNFDGKFDMNTKTHYTFSGYLQSSKSEGKWTNINFKGNYSFQKQ